MIFSHGIVFRGRSSLWALKFGGFLGTFRVSFVLILPLSSFNLTLLDDLRDL
jgi:hypothetical protein